MVKKNKLRGNKKMFVSQRREYLHHLRTTKQDIWIPIVKCIIIDKVVASWSKQKQQLVALFGHIAPTTTHINLT